MSSGKVWVMPVRVTVTLVRLVPNPETKMSDEYGVAGVGGLALSLIVMGPVLENVVWARTDKVMARKISDSSVKRRANPIFIGESYLDSYLAAFLAVYIRKILSYNFQGPHVNKKVGNALVWGSVG